jgi:pimeloyl-ACP methyl ester carboxylesterase
MVRGELARHLTLVLLENRGIGRSEMPKKANWTIDQLADDTVGLIQALNLNRPHVLGHSMGGAVAQTIAYRYPEQVGKVVVAQSLLHRTPIGEAVMGGIMHLHEDGVSAARRAEIVMPWLFSNRMIADPDFCESFIRTTAESQRPPSLELMKGQYAALKAFDSREWCARITTPTLVLCGEHDLICPPAQMEELARKVPGAKLHVFKDCAHVAPVEQSGEFCRVVTDYLSS